MAPSPSPDAAFTTSGMDALLDIAESAIAMALTGSEPAPPPLNTLPPELRIRAGAFVTLTINGELNGCIGTIEGDQPLGHAVGRLALSAAFADPRLPVLRPKDYLHLTIELSLLSPLSPIDADSRNELLAALRPGHDGLVIDIDGHPDLFLPSVWEQIPHPDDFLDHLWRKAGRIPRTWPPELRAFRFTVQSRKRQVREPTAA